jgi:hypothetical protein
VVRNRVIVAFGVVLFLVLAGTGTASALWSSQSQVGGTVAAATMGITQTNFESMAVDYNSTTTQKVAPVTVTNTGTVALRYSALLRGPSNNAIATSASVQAKTVSTTGACTNSTNVTTYKWTTLPALTGTLNPGASVIYCVQSSMTTAQISANVGKTMDATLALTATSSVGSWTASDDGTAVQSTRDTVAPSAPTITVSGTSATATTLTWPSSTDNVGVVAYDLYRNGVMVASGLGNTWTDTSLVRNTTYTYKLDARDAAGNIGSSSVTVKTLNINSASWYTIRPSQNAGLCIDASGGGTGNGTSLVLWSCNGGDNEAWQFVGVANGNYRISAKHVPTSGISIPTWSNNAAQLWSYNNDAMSQWKAVSVGTTGTLFQFVNVSTGRCLDLSSSTPASNTGLVQATCNTLTTANRQAFTIAVDN